MASKELSKKFNKVDEENFEIVEARETTTNVNIKLFPKQIANFKKDMVNKITENFKSEKILKNAIETYNTLSDELVKAKELGYDIEIPTKYTLEELRAEVKEALDNQD